MNRFLLLLVALAATLAIACGSGDKNDDDGSDERPAATATSEADEGSDDADSNGDEASSDDDLLDDEASADDDASGGANPAGFFSPLLGLGLGGATGGGPATLPGVQQGSGDLEQYLPGEDAVPDGYESMGTFSMTLPADASQDFPGGEIAMSMWAPAGFQSSGDIPEGSMLMIAVMRPDDPSAVDEFAGGCDGFDEDALSEGLGNGEAGFLGIEFKDIETLDSSGLGDSACGIGLTMDMSGFFEGLQEGFGEEFGGEDVPDDVIDALSAFKMRMRMFGEGDKVGMVMQIGFGADADLADDLSIAQELRGNLQ